MPNGKGQIELARERLVKVVNQAGRGQEEGEEQEGQLALILMVLLGGRSSVRNAAETFGLDYANLLETLGELDYAWRDWRSCQTGEGSDRHRGRHRGPRRSRGKDVSP